MKDSVGRMGLRVLIVDDHAIVRTGLRSVLTHTVPGAEIREATDGHDALTRAAELAPDIVLMDISMPGLNGLEATRRLVRQLPDCKVIILSMHKDEDHVVQALRAGAAGYLVKDTVVDELPAAIAAVQRGEAFISHSIPKTVTKLLAANEPQGLDCLLTARQREILQLIAEGQSTKEIGFRLNLSGKTVETHRRLLMQRLAIFDVAGLARFAVRTGLVAADH